MTKRWIMAALIAAALVAPAVPAAAGARGAGGGGGACGAFASGAVVELRDVCVAGTAHFAPEGELVVRNTGEAQHNLVAVDGSFATPLLDGGDEATLELGAGVHRVYCTLHGTATGGGMAGVLIVGDSPEFAPIAAKEGGDGSNDLAWPLVLAVGGGVVVVGLVVGYILIARRVRVHGALDLHASSR